MKNYDQDHNTVQYCVIYDCITGINIGADSMIIKFNQDHKKIIK